MSFPTISYLCVSRNNNFHTISSTIFTHLLYEKNTPFNNTLCFIGFEVYSYFTVFFIMVSARKKGKTVHSGATESSEM